MNLQTTAPLSATAVGGYVAPPPDVQAVVTVGFFTIWLTRNTLKLNGVEGKLLYVHHHSLWIARWLFNWPGCSEKKWTSVGNFQRDADKAFSKKINQYLAEKEALTAGAHLERNKP